MQSLFKPEHFKKIPATGTNIEELIAETANEILNAAAEDAVTVYGAGVNPGSSALWTMNKPDTWITHEYIYEAKLMFMQQTRNHTCRHEPRKHYISPSRTVAYEPVCYFCGENISATWKKEAFNG